MTKEEFFDLKLKMEDKIQIKSKLGKVVDAFYWHHVFFKNTDGFDFIVNIDEYEHHLDNDFIINGDYDRIFFVLTTKSIYDHSKTELFENKKLSGIYFDDIDYIKILKRKSEK